MEIRTFIETKAGTFPVHYRDVSNWEEIDSEKVHHVGAYCFCDGKFIVVHNESKHRNHWTPPGGGREAGESAAEATVREIAEESNMRVLKQIPIGYQEITEPHRTTIQTRSFCLVEPIGPFESDPDGDITEISLIDPADSKRYFDWGKVGDHVMSRALELLAQEKK